MLSKHISKNPAGISPAGRFLIHAGAILMPRGVLLLIGPSGTGKSTMCRMLSAYYPVINDDTCVMHYDESDGWLVGSSLALMPDWYPFAGIVRLWQAPVIRLKRLSALKAARYMTHGIFEVGAQVAVKTVMKRDWFHTVSDIARTYPGWELEFYLGDDAASQIATIFTGLD